MKQIEMKVISKRKKERNAKICTYSVDIIARVCVSEWVTVESVRSAYKKRAKKKIQDVSLIVDYRKKNLIIWKTFDSNSIFLSIPQFSWIYFIYPQLSYLHFLFPFLFPYAPTLSSFSFPLLFFCLLFKFNKGKISTHSHTHTPLLPHCRLFFFPLKEFYAY